MDFGELQQQADAAAEELQQAAERINNDGRLSDQGRAEQIQAAQDTYTETVQALQQQARETIEGERESVDTRRRELRESQLAKTREVLGDQVTAQVLLASWQQAGPSRLLDVLEAGSEFEAELLRLAAPSVLDGKLDAGDAASRRLRVKLAEADPELAALDAQAEDLRAAEHQIGNLDPAGRELRLRQRFRI